MKRLRQPTRHSCGQTCLAMLLDLPVEEIVADLGDRKTTTKDLREYLISKAVHTNPTRRLTSDGFHYLCGQYPHVVMKQGKTPEGKKWKHWVIVYWREDHSSTGDTFGHHIVLDPAINGTHTLEQYKKKGYLDNAKFTSYFTVLRGR